MGSGSHLMAVLLAEVCQPRSSRPGTEQPHAASIQSAPQNDMIPPQQQGWDTSALRYEAVATLEGARDALRAGPGAPPRANGFLWEKFMTKPLVRPPAPCSRIAPSAGALAFHARWTLPTANTDTDTD